MKIFAHFCFEKWPFAHFCLGFEEKLLRKKWAVARKSGLLPTFAG
jgi:hypothetical protein